MSNERFGRRDFLKTAVAGAAGATVTVTGVAPATAQAQVPAAPPTTAPAPGYSFLNLDEAPFVEALVDHMIPSDEYTPKGTDVGVNIYLDRSLSSGWGAGDRLYMQGPWKIGEPSQGYQLPLTPAELFRAGVAATNAHCRKTYGKVFDQLTAPQRDEVLIGLSSASIAFDSGLPVAVFWTALYQSVMEGMFADPIYGGNRDKAGWKLIGFPGVIAVHRDNIEKYRDKEYRVNPLSIADIG
jgi:gluconate 2-dehydrogenase gamma chain